MRKSIALMAGEYISRLNVQPYNKDAWILEVTFQATHLKRAIDFVNSLTTYFVNMGLSREKNQTARNTIRFIDEQIAITTDSLFIAESSLQRFRQDRQLMDVRMF
jgi:tyrosine-protein kinase Etk/Wzc